MKGRRFIVFITLLAGFALSASILWVQNQNDLQGFNSSNPAAKQEIRKEKFTILPIILIGGIQIFRETFEKK